MKNFNQHLKVILFFTLLTNLCAGQKDYWSVYFPGYLSYAFKSNVAPDECLNLALNSDNATQPNKFVSLDKKGLVVYQQSINETALLNFKDSTGNRYLVSYSMPVLHIQKYNPQNTLIWNNPITLTDAIDTSWLPFYQLICASQYLLTSNGNLAIAGLFKEDTISGWESLNVFFIDTASGSILNEYDKYNLESPITNINLQEDDAGNINVLYFNEVTEEAYLKKITQSGTLISQQTFGDAQNWTSQKESIKITPDFIYVALTDDNYDFHVLKLGKTLLDTIFYNNYSAIWDFGNYFDANDSAFYLSYDDGMWGAFASYDFYGNPVCSDASGNYFNYGYKFCNVGNKCYTVRNSLGETADTACNFVSCTPDFDSNTQNLIWTYMGSPYSYPTHNTVSKNVIYFVSRNISYVLGVVGIIDSMSTNFAGKLYFDSNNNCADDSAEVGLPNQLIRIDPQGKYLFTGTNGNFENYLDSGSYTLSAVPFNPTLNFCPVSIALNIQDTTLLYDENNFAVQDQSGNLQDLAITINQTPCIPGYFTNVYVTVTNNEPLQASGFVRLSMDTTLFSLVYSNPNPDSISGNNYYWHVSNLNILTQSSFFIEFNVSSSAIIGDHFTSLAEVVNYSGESNLTDNTDIFQGTIVGSYDPNAKNVIPAGAGPAGIISPVDTLLNYKIQFQNTGTYMAYTVKVIDTIDASLDISTFRLRSVSHNCHVSFIGTNVLLFTFNNILLPDSSANEPLSHGFINYSIRTKSNLPLLTQMRNKAYIYFDFNDPVVTNETLNTIDVLGINEINKVSGIYLFPNPARDALQVITNEKIQTINLSVYDVEGRNLQTGNVSVINGTASLSISALRSGFYFLKTESDKLIVVKSFIKL